MHDSFLVESALQVRIVRKHLEDAASLSAILKASSRLSSFPTFFSVPSFPLSLAQSLSFSLFLSLFLPAVRVDSQSRLPPHRAGWPRYHSRRINWERCEQKKPTPYSDAASTLLRHSLDTLYQRRGRSVRPAKIRPGPLVYEVICFPERAKFCR